MGRIQHMFKGQTVVITGGASGIGRACAVLFTERGARVFVGDLTLPDENAELFGRLNIKQRKVDVQKEDDVRNLVAEAGTVHIAVASAGRTLVRQVPDVTADEWDSVLDTNLRGVFLLCKHAIPTMQRRGDGGSIVVISSNAGLLPRAHDPVYSVSKGALQAFMRALALAHSPDGIRVNA